MDDQVMVGIASLPEREGSLERVVDALAPQADRIMVSLNGYTHWPNCIDLFPNVYGTVRATNAGDAEKFAAVDDWDGYVATCDDDVLYPPDYIKTLITGIGRYGRERLVSFHGGTTAGWNGSHGAASDKRIRCLGALAADDPDVNVLGTGTLGWHAGNIPIWRDLFRGANMADVYLATHARTFGLPMAALAHKGRWLCDISPKGSAQIYESNRRGDGSVRDTRERRKLELERFDWTQPPPRKPRVRVSIATCDRPLLLSDLLNDLEREARWVDVELAVYEDCSGTDYGKCRAAVSESGGTWHRFERRLGREGHWQLVGRELADCRESSADWFVFLPDDVRLVRHALPRALEIWARLEQPAALTLWRLKDHEGQPNWTGRLPVERDHAWEVFHVDGIYLCRRETLEFLDYGCPRPSVRRRRGTSSGVGRGISLKLHMAGKRMYRVSNSLAVPLPPAQAPSIMNPDAGDRVYAGIAL